MAPKKAQRNSHVRTHSNPFVPSTRAYWTGFSRENDEVIAMQLFFGRRGHDKKGRVKKEYLVQDSPPERLAREALVRLLTYFTTKEAPIDVIAALCSALRGSAERRLVFKFQKKGNRPDLSGDIAVTLLVDRRRQEGVKVESAVREAMDVFDLSRKAVFAAIKRVKTELASWNMSK
jgi:hypothetical protein